MTPADEDCPAAGRGPLPVLGCQRPVVLFGQGEQGSFQLFERFLPDPFHHRIQGQTTAAQQFAQVRLRNGSEPLPQEAEFGLSEPLGPDFREVLVEKRALGLPCDWHGDIG